MTGRVDLPKRGRARGSRRSPTKKRVLATAAPRKGLSGTKARKRVFANKRGFADKTAKPLRRRIAEPSSGVAALAVLAHETRTALNGILAWSELLAATVLEDRQRGWASGLKQTAEHLSALTSIIVDAAQVESGTLTLREDTFRPRALFDEIAASLAARTEIKGLATGAVVEGDLPDFVVGDPVRIRAALDNLMDNAVKFTARGAVRLSLTASLQDAKAATAPSKTPKVRSGEDAIKEDAEKIWLLTFTLTDTGLGMSKAEMRRLLRPFTQAHAGIGRRFGGAGLGLSFVRMVVTQMGGSLTLGSRPGEGSDFRLTVPVRSGDGKTLRPHESAVEGGSVRALRLLCVEDNPYNRIVLKTMLGELGHDADFVDSGSATLTALTRGGYDAVLMDVELRDTPGADQADREMDGCETTRRIRALSDPVRAVPVIGVSGRSGEAERKKALSAGMNAYLSKPVSARVLAATLEPFSSVAPGKHDA